MKREHVTLKRGGSSFRYICAGEKKTKRHTVFGHVLPVTGGDSELYTHTHTYTAMPVDSYIQRMFGATDAEAPDHPFAKRVLLVGAGGIGCELLKNLIMMNIAEIHVLDLDTIDLSNLNRQFLFRHRDIKQSKSKTAIKAVQFFNYASKLVAHHGSILDVNTYPLSFFKQFDLVYNALDNLEARFHVNRMCMYLNIPLYESGTTGLRGQVQPIYPHLTECFSCVPKETPKSFPVCTIRSTPSKPVHCITWAKDFLLSQLFSDEQQDQQEEQKNESDSVTADEIATEATRETEVNELAELRALVIDPSIDDVTLVTTIFTKIFVTDIERLLSIAELWTSRPKPVIDNIRPYEKVFSTSLETYPFTVSTQETLECILATFKVSLLNLAKRLRNSEIISFDKDDQETLRFVMSASNIRSLIFNIPTKNEFDTKQIAGNIIPAVATMNAIIAGFSALSSIAYYAYPTNEERVRHSKMVYDSASTSTDKVLNSSALSKPNPHCSACSIVKGVITIPLMKTTLGELRDELVSKYGYDDDVEIMTLDSRVLYDMDLEENLEKKVGDFITGETVLLIGDADEKWDILELYVVDGEELVLPDLTLKVKISVKENSGEDNEDVGELQDGVVVLDDDDDGEDDDLQEVEEIVEIEEVEDVEPPTKKRRIV